jgi:hypothetical protein
MPAEAHDKSRASFNRPVLIACAAVAVLLTVIGTWMTLARWDDFPEPALNRISNDPRLSDVYPPKTALAREAQRVAGFAGVVADRWLRRAEDAAPTLNPRSPGTNVSQLDRLYQVALRLEGADTFPQPSRDRAIARDVAALHDADWRHYLDAFGEASVEALGPLGLDEGTAYNWSVQQLAARHYTALQITHQRLFALEQRLRTNEDADLADAVRRTRHRALHSLIHENGPVGLRLLAIDLLADELEQIAAAAAEPEAAAATPSTPLTAVEADLLPALRATQTHWRQELQARHPSPLAVPSGHTVPIEYYPGMSPPPGSLPVLIDQLAICHALIGCTLVLAVATSVTIAFWGNTTGEPTGRETIVLIIATAIVSVLLIFVVQHRLLPEGLYDRYAAAYALRNALSGLALDIRLTFVGAGIAVGILITAISLVLTSIIFRRRAHRIQLAWTLLSLWAVTALLLLLAAPLNFDPAFERWASTRCHIEDVTHNNAAPLRPDLARFERALRD